MLTITDLITVLSMCAAFYGLGYVHGQHESKAKKITAQPEKLMRLFKLVIIR